MKNPLHNYDSTTYHLKGQCVGIEAVQVLVNTNYHDVFTRNTSYTARIKRLSESEKFSTQNSNTHKRLPVIDRVDKAIHGPDKALVNSMRLFLHGQTAFQHATSHICT